MMATTLLNHDDTPFGLNSLRTTSLIGASAALRSVRWRKDETRSGNDVSDVAGADAGLLHGCRVDVHLDGRIAPGAQVELEARRDRHHEQKPAPIHRILDLARRR